MNKKDIEKTLLIEKKVSLIGTLEFNKKTYVKTLNNQKEDIEYIYYEIKDEDIKKVEDKLIIEYLKKMDGYDSENIIY